MSSASQLSIRSFFRAKPPTATSPPSASPPSASPPKASPPKASPPKASQPKASQPMASQPPSKPSISTPNIPPEASIRPLTPADITPLRRLNSLLLPVSYQDSFYQRAADASTGRFSRAITWSHGPLQPPKLVGAIVCRLDPDPNPNTNSNPNPKSSTPPALYIQSLCLLAPYRSLGLIAAALDSIVAAVLADPSVSVDLVTAHVWTDNQDGLRWYLARGFTCGPAPIPGYYLKLRPDSAWLVSRPLSSSASSSSSSNPPGRQQLIAGTTAAVLNLPPSIQGLSYQNQRPDTEWNDLPDDMTPSSLLAAPRRNDREHGSSAASSRSSSSARKKRDRAYPVAAFGN